MIEQDTVASIETTEGEEKIILGIGNEHIIDFASMTALAAFSDNLVGQVSAWRADVKFAELTGARRIVADAITENMREQIRKVGDEAAALAFPEDVLFDKQWMIQAERLPEGLQLSIETSVKELICSLTECFVVAKEKADAIFLD